MAGKAAAGQGSVRELTPGLSYRLRWRDAKGQHGVTFRGTKAQADAELRAILHRRDQGLMVPGDRRRTFEQWTAEWWRTHAETLTPASIKRQGQIVDIVVDALGAYPLAKLTEAHVLDAIEGWRAAGMAGTQLELAVRMTKTVLREAKRRGAATRDAGEYVPVPSHPRRQVTPPTRAQVDAVLHAVANHHYFPAFALSAATGLRISEVAGLHWRDIDLAGRTVHVRASKTSAGVRSFRIPPQVAAALAPFQGQPDAYVTASLHGTEVDGRNLRRVLHQTCDQLGLPRFRWHDFRHAAATAMLDMGNDISKVARFLGHTDPGFTRRTYVHLYPDLQELDDALDISPEVATRVQTFDSTLTQRRGRRGTAKHKTELGAKHKRGVAK